MSSVEEPTLLVGNGETALLAGESEPSPLYERCGCVRSLKHAHWAAYLVIAMLCYEFMATFLTIFPYWLSLGGEARVGGLLYGLYGGMQALGAPFWGYAADAFGELSVLLLCLVLNLGGNGLYFLSSAFSPNQLAVAKALVMVSRILCGFSSGAIVVALRFLIATTETTPEAQLKVMNKFVLTSMLGRTLAPIIAIAFLYIDQNRYHMGPIQLNYATFPALITVCCEVVVFVVMWVAYFRPPSLPQVSSTSSHAGWKIWRDPALAPIWNTLMWLLLCLTLLMTGLWFIYSQLIPITMFVYSIVDGVETLWLPYVPLAIGALGYSLPVVRLFWYCNISETHQIWFMMGGLVLSIIPLFPFVRHPNEWLFFTSAAGFFLFVTGLQTSLRTVYSRLLTDSSHLGILLSLLFISSGIAQLFGSSWGGAVIDPAVDNRWLLAHNCSLDYAQFPLNYTCASCTVTTAQFYNATVDGQPYSLDCQYLSGYSILLALTLAIFIVTAGLLYKTLKQVKQLDAAALEHSRTLPPIDESSYLLAENELRKFA